MNEKKYKKYSEEFKLSVLPDFVIASPKNLRQRV